MSAEQKVAEATRTAVLQVLDALDWAALAGIYCETGGEAFWEEHREPVIHHGLRWGLAMGRRLDAEGPAGAGGAGGHPGRGRSLYVGAGVAEIPPMVFEHLQLGREVHACNLRAQECDILNRGFAAVGLPLRVEGVDAAELLAADGANPLRVDHLACVSVCSDPESFPVVSGLAYGAVHPAQCSPAAYGEEHDRLTHLVASLLGTLDAGDGAWCVTTDEELPWFLAAAESRGWTVQLDEEQVPTAVVGDAICFLHVDPNSAT